jgi:hypothetical protein
LLIRVESKKPRLDFIENVIITPGGFKMGTEPGRLWQGRDYPLQLRGINTDLVPGAAACPGARAAPAGVVNGKDRREVDVNAAMPHNRRVFFPAVNRRY